MCNKKNRRLSAEKKQKVYQDWLVQTYPGLFNDQFLPLPVGVFEQLNAALPEHISKTDLRIVLGWYASRIKYLHNIRNLSHRYNLDGTAADAISEVEKLAAAKKIKEITLVRKSIQKKAAAA